MALVHRRLVQKLLSITVFVLAASAASAAPKDKAANAKIEEAIYEDYLATNFKKAEKKLRGIIKACGSKCSKAVVAKAWMYVGIVRATGSLPGADSAFEKALQTDPRVKLDEDIASDEARADWASAQASMGGGGGDDDDGVDLEEEGGDDEGGTECTPTVTEVEKGRPIPVSCPADPDAKSGQLRYKEFGSDRWETVKMRKRRGQYQATIPCTATGILGKVRYYVRTKDRDGETIDEFGSRRSPFELDIVAETDEEPPAFPRKDPPDICEESVECPPGMPGCGQECSGGFQTKGWGTSCDESCECEDGLSCLNGSCETGAACSSDSDCGDGSCEDGVCKDDVTKPKSGDVPVNWVGVQFGIDLAWMSAGADVCNPPGTDNITCYKSGTDDRYLPPDGYEVETGVINGGFALATLRIMASYDRLITPNIDLGGRLGFAFRGGPPANKTSFMPVHVEGRATWRFLPDGIINPYAGVAGGMAQVDAKKQVDAQLVKAGESDVPIKGDLDAWKKVGTGFAALTGGAYYNFTREMALQVNVNLMYFFPSSGTVLEPSLGVIYGF
jgi:hypothetical protein